MLNKCFAFKKRVNEVKEVKLSSSDDCKQRRKLLTNTPHNNVIVINDSPTVANVSSIDVELITPTPKRPCLIDLTESPVIIVDTSTLKSGYVAEKSVASNEAKEKRTASDFRDTNSTSQSIENLKDPILDPECSALMPECKVLFAHSDMQCDATMLQRDCDTSMDVQSKCCDGTTPQHGGVTTMDLQTETCSHSEISSEDDGPSSTLVSAQEQPQSDSRHPEIDEDSNGQFLNGPHKSNTKFGVSPGHESVSPVASLCTTNSSISPLPNSTDSPSFVETETSIAECCAQIESKPESNAPLQQQQPLSNSDKPLEAKDKGSFNQLSHKLQNSKTNFQLPMGHESASDVGSVSTENSGKHQLTTERESSMHEAVHDHSPTVFTTKQSQSCSKKLSDKRSELSHDHKSNQSCTKSQLSTLKEEGSLSTSLSAESSKTCPLPPVKTGTWLAESYGHHEMSTKDDGRSSKLVSTHEHSVKPSKKTDEGSNGKLPNTKCNSSANLQHSGDKGDATLISAENSKMTLSPRSVKSDQLTSGSTQVNSFLSTSTSMNCNTALLSKAADSAPVSSSSKWVHKPLIDCS